MLHARNAWTHYSGRSIEASRRKHAAVWGDRKPHLPQSCREFVIVGCIRSCGRGAARRAYLTSGNKVVVPTEAAYHHGPLATTAQWCALPVRPLQQRKPGTCVAELVDTIVAELSNTTTAKLQISSRGRPGDARQYALQLAAERST